MTTQQTTDNTNELKTCLRIGQMFNAEGELFYFELCNRKVQSGYQVELTIYKGAHKLEAQISETIKAGLTLAEARTAWAAYFAEVTSAYSVVSYETSTKLAGQPWVEKKWEAKPEGGIKSVAASFHDGNEGHYVVITDTKKLTLTYGGTCCPDIPAEYTTEVFTSVEALEVASGKRMSQTRQRWIAEDLTITHANFVRQTTRLTGGAA